MVSKAEKVEAEKIEAIFSAKPLLQSPDKAKFEDASKISFYGHGLVPTGHKPSRGVTIRMVLELLGAKCSTCDSMEELEIDHVVALSNGGENTVDNLQVLCHYCHLVKTRSEP